MLGGGGGVGNRGVYVREISQHIWNVHDTRMCDESANTQENLV